MEIQYPDYRNCVANLACSILNYYGITPPNSTLAYADQYLNKKYKNVVLLLLDGMGTSTIDKHLNCDGFFNKNLKSIYSSTFPSTTVAATTAIESGLFPNQSAWIGWSSYFKDINKNIAYFRNYDNDTFELIDNMDVAKKFVPYVGIREQINNAGIETHCVSPFNNMAINTYDDFCLQIKLLCSSNEMKYIYAYWEEPDKSMHIYGEESAEVHNNLIYIEEKTKHLASELQDTLLIITADHGQIHVNNKSILEYPDLIDCLVRMPSVEARACNFFVKKGKKRNFVRLFKKHFNDDFLLLSKSQFLKSELLGFGNNHIQLESMIGDYFAIAVKDTAIINRQNGPKGNHAGLTKSEMSIPLIIVDCVLEESNN